MLFFVAVAMATSNLHRLINGKNKNWHLLLFPCRYFDESFLEMFVKWSSTKHIIFVQTSQFDRLSWQPKCSIFEKYSKIDSSEAIWEDKAETLQKCS